MKRVLLLLFLFCVFGAPASVSAQGTDLWIPFADDSEFFRVLVPNPPQTENFNTLVTNYGELEVRGKSYMATGNGAIYMIWALTNSGNRIQHRKDPDGYLDAAAELVWEGLLKLARDKLPEQRQKTTGRMTYEKEVTVKPLPGRAYSIAMGQMAGTAEFFVNESRIYVLVAMGPVAGTWTREPFFSSFELSPRLPDLKPPDGTEAGEDTVDLKEQTPADQIFQTNEVTERMHILAKPEPSYTENARKFGVTGTVVLRAVFSKDGQVTNIHVIRKLPHGLTKRTLDAARAIRFSPATKDGQPVSMWIQLEYNFNLY